jgi:DivIVA domain-containing protein
MISASIAETHRFGRVRKNGYDPAEVDAVVARLVDALRNNDERIAALTKRIDTADASADAIRQTFVAAQATSDEIIDRANEEAAAVLAEAKVEAEALAKSSEELQAEIATQRDRILTGAYADAEDRLAEIERQTAERAAEAEWAIQEALDVRDRTVSEAQADAAAVVHAAEARAESLRDNIATMAQRALALERAAAALAESAQEGADILDLVAIEELEQEPDETIEQDNVTEPETDLDDEPLQSVSELAEDATDDEELPATRYQKSTGLPLKERIKIARMSG